MIYKSPDTGNEISCIMHGILDNFLKDTKKLEEKLSNALKTDKLDILISRFLREQDICRERIDVFYIFLLFYRLSTDRLLYKISVVNI